MLFVCLSLLLRARLPTLREKTKHSTRSLNPGRIKSGAVFCYVQDADGGKTIHLSILINLPDSLASQIILPAYFSVIRRIASAPDLVYQALNFLVPLLAGALYFFLVPLSHSYHWQEFIIMILQCQGY